MEDTQIGVPTYTMYTVHPPLFQIHVHSGYSTHLTHIVRECVCVKKKVYIFILCFVTDTVSGDITHRITQVYPAQFRFRYTGYTSPIYRDPTQTVLVNRDRLHATPSVPVL